MEYKHIDDCWNAIRNAKTISEVQDLFDDFPRWSGDWDVEVQYNSFFEKCYVVYNYYYDKNLGEEQTDCETLEIPYEDDEDDEL